MELVFSVHWDSGDAYARLWGTSGNDVHLQLGVEDTARGVLTLIGQRASSAAGARINLTPSTNYKSTVPGYSYKIEVEYDDLQIGPWNGPCLKYDAGLGHFTLGDHLQLGDDIETRWGDASGGEASAWHDGAFNLRNYSGLVQAVQRCARPGPVSWAYATPATRPAIRP